MSVKAAKKEAKAKACTVVVRDEVEGGAPLVRVGQIRSYFEWRPPWDPHGQAADVMQIADVQWYWPKGVHAELIDAPQVTRAFHSHAAGNLIGVQEIVPVHVCLVPHLEQSNWWQVLILHRA